MVELKVGDKAPDFTLETDDGKPVTLSKLKGNKVILYVYPAAFTPGCSLEAQDFRDADKAFEKAGYKVLGLSPDTVEKNASFAQKMKLPYELVSDPDHKVLESYGAWGEKEAFGRKTIGVIRSTFVIGEDGRLEVAEYRVKAAGHVERLAQELGVNVEGF
ncbi:MAG: thioredoxin-dependent thiol peroxidase [Bifidobacteriaceae bacterium]|nr:thioredoxin-dependent thiol peroxidase [Bifidobacteriaceae bacterium]